MNERQQAQLRSIVYQLEGVTETIKMLRDGIDLEGREGFEITAAWDHLECALRHAREASYLPETATTEGGE